MEYSKSKIPFLDIFIKRDKNDILMDLYHKPTDTEIFHFVLLEEFDLLPAQCGEIKELGEPKAKLI